ncbi:hypothetical protein LSPCS325_26700 [Lysinibacillus sp. CTST325]
MHQGDIDFATFVNNQIVKNVNMNDQKVKKENFIVIASTNIPAILVELGFLSNSEDRAKYYSKQ